MLFHIYITKSSTFLAFENKNSIGWLNLFENYCIMKSIKESENMKWVKENKFTIIAMVLFILVLVLGYKAIEIFFPDQKSAIYGDRLEGKVDLKKTTLEEVKQKITEKEKVKVVTISESGRRINIIITVEDDMSKNDAKHLVDNILEPFNESQIGYYDFEVFVKKDNKEENDFPIIGYKQHNSSSFSWTKDREKTEEED